MSKDICPIKLVRCKDYQSCDLTHCTFDRYAKPVSDNELSKADRYKLVMAEQKARAP